MAKLITDCSKKNDLLVVDLAKAQNILKNINWNFTQKVTLAFNEITPFNCRKYHWFPSTFVPEIPFTLIEVLSLPGAVVYDPFSGIGTTYFQALLLNRFPLATESCSVAVNYMRDLFKLFNPKLDHSEMKDSIKKLLLDFTQDEDYVSYIGSQASINDLKPWYSEKTLNKLAYLFYKESQCDDEAIKAAMRIVISSILKNVCNQDRGWGCIADNVLPRDNQMKDKDVLYFFNKNINLLFNDIASYLKKTDTVYKMHYDYLSKRSTIIRGDVRESDEIPEESVDLIVTSPPYPNMTDYVTSQRLSYYYSNLDIKSDLNLEIGARIKRFKKDSLECYFNDMQRANEAIAKRLKKGGYACYIMPFFNKDNQNNIGRREVIQNVLIDLSRRGLMEESQFERVIPAKRRSQNIKWATLEREKIYLFRKI